MSALTSKSQVVGTQSTHGAIAETAIAINHRYRCALQGFRSHARHINRYLVVGHHRPASSRWTIRQVGCVKQCSCKQCKYQQSAPSRSRALLHTAYSKLPPCVTTVYLSWPNNAIPYKQSRCSVWLQLQESLQVSLFSALKLRA